MKSRQIDLSRPVAGTYLFTGALAQRGYRLNKFCMSLTDAANRAAFKEDEDAYMDRHRLGEEEKALVRARDWLGMVRHGACAFMVFKVSGATGFGLAATGAQMRGETLEEYLATRNVNKLVATLKEF